MASAPGKQPVCNQAVNSVSKLLQKKVYIHVDTLVKHNRISRTPQGLESGFRKCCNILGQIFSSLQIEIKFKDCCIQLKRTAFLYNA